MWEFVGVADGWISSSRASGPFMGHLVMPMYSHAGEDLGIFHRYLVVAGFLVQPSFHQVMMTVGGTDQFCFPADLSSLSSEFLQRQKFEHSGWPLPAIWTQQSWALAAVTSNWQAITQIPCQVEAGTFEITLFPSPGCHIFLSEKKMHYVFKSFSHAESARGTDLFGYLQEHSQIFSKWSILTWISVREWELIWVSSAWWHLIGTVNWSFWGDRFCMCLYLCVKRETYLFFSFHMRMDQRHSLPNWFIK